MKNKIERGYVVIHDDDLFQFLIIFSDVNECSNDLCQNGGMCVNEVKAYTCLCAPGFIETTVNKVII
jgi:hypothetical protein